MEQALSSDNNRLGGPSDASPILKLLAERPLYKILTYVDLNRDVVRDVLGRQEIIAHPDVQQAALAVLREALQAGNEHLADWAIRSFSLQVERIPGALRDEIRAGLIAVLTHDNPNSSFQASIWARKFGMSDEERAHPDVINAARAIALREISRDQMCHYLADLVPPALLLRDPIFESQIFEHARAILTTDGWDRFEQLCIEFDLRTDQNGTTVYGGSWIAHPALKAAGLAHIRESLSKGDLPVEIEKLCKQLQIGATDFSSDSTCMNAAKSFAASVLNEGHEINLYRLEVMLRCGLIGEHDLADTAIQSAGTEGYVELIERGSFEKAAKLKSLLKLSDQVHQDPRFIEAVKNFTLRILQPVSEPVSFGQQSWFANPLAEVTSLIGTPEWIKDPAIQAAAFPQIDRLLAHSQNDIAQAIMRSVGLEEDCVRTLPGLTGTLCRGLELSSLAEWLAFSKEESGFLAVHRKRDDGQAALLTKAHYEAGKALHLTTNEVVTLLAQNIDVTALHEKGAWEVVASALLQHGEAWQDPIVQKHFKEAVQYFGSTEKVLAFMDRPGLLRHDALIEMPRLIQIAQSSDIKPSALYGQILSQVSKDGAMDAAHSNAHLKLNHIVKTFQYDAVMAAAAEYGDIPEIARLAEAFHSPKAPFSSWAHLQQFARLQELLEKRELLQALGNLAPAERAVLGPFIDEVAIRAGAKADLGQAVLFLVKPEQFLDTPDQHTPRHIHERKKPSAFLHIPHLDLTARQLTTALVDGTYDRLQSLPPLQVQYSATMLGGNGKETAVTLLATLHRKGDARGYTVQGDTGSCDAFGSGKQTVAAFNTEVAYFSVQVVRPDGGTRAIAQSMITMDCNAGRPVPDIVKAIDSPNAKISRVLDSSVLAQGERVLTCDNIEVARNYRSPEWQTLLEQVYVDFFAEYLQAEGQAAGLDTTRVLIGENLTPLFPSQPRIPNTWVPVAPPSYSDNLGANIIEVTVKDTFPESGKTTTNYGRAAVEAPPPSSDPHIEFLRPSDALSTAWVEERAYQGNDSLIVSLHSIENTLIASHVNNQVKGRPDLSLKYVSDDGRLLGYMLAYEGRYSDTKGGLLPAGSPMLYIADLATDPEVRRVAGGRLVQAFVDRWIAEYANKENIPPLVAELREGTSYRLVMAKLRQIEERTGIRFEAVEGESFRRGGERMIPVVIHAHLRAAPRSIVDLSASRV